MEQERGAPLWGGGEGVRNVRHLEWRNFGAEKISHRFLNTTANLAQNSQIVAQEQAYTTNVACYFLLDFGWLLLNFLSWLLNAYCYFLEACNYYNSL